MTKQNAGFGYGHGHSQLGMTTL